MYVEVPLMDILKRMIVQNLTAFLPSAGCSPKAFDGSSDWPGSGIVGDSVSMFAVS